MESHRMWRRVLDRCLTLRPGRTICFDGRACRRPRVGCSVPERWPLQACARSSGGRPSWPLSPRSWLLSPWRAGGGNPSRRGRAGRLRVAAPEIQRLTDDGDYAAAFILAQQALVAAPGNPHLEQLWLDASVLGSFTTDPAGATVEFAEYRRAGGAWQPLGTTPIAGRRIPRGLVRVRVSKPGFQTIEASAVTARCSFSTRSGCGRARRHGAGRWRSRRAVRWRRRCR